MKFGLFLTVAALALTLAGNLAAALGKKVTKTETANGDQIGEATAVTAITAPGLLKDLIGAAATLVAVPAGVGAFVMLIGTILIVGVVFAD